MIYMLDTDMLIFMIRGLKTGRPTKHRKNAERVVERCQSAQTNGHSVSLSAITVAELEFGARRSDGYDEEIAAVRKILLPFDTQGFDPVACPEHYGRIRADLEGRGIPIGSMDLLIAAHASALDATLVSNNTAHFSRVKNLKVENWLK